MDLNKQKEKELAGVYPLLNMGDYTLLCLVSYCHCKPEVFQLLLQAGFPKNLLLSKCMGKNTLHFAISFDDADLVDVLLEDESRRKILLESSITINGRSLTIKEYAEWCGYSNKHQFQSSLFNQE